MQACALKVTTVGALTCFDSRGLQRADSTLFREERRPSTRTRWASQSPLDPVSPTPTLACPPQPCTLLSFTHSLLFPSFARALFLSQVYAPNSHRQQFPPCLLTVFVWQAGRPTVRHAEHGSTTFPSCPYLIGDLAQAAP